MENLKNLCVCSQHFKQDDFTTLVRSVLPPSKQYTIAYR